MDEDGQRLTYEDYLQLEVETGIKHEYYDGAAVAMSGGSYDHARITTNTVVALSGQVRAPCEVFTSELRVQTADGFTTYPDASVVCENRRSETDPNAVVTPSVLFEVLSPSTRDHDLGFKFEQYRRIPTATHIVFVDSERIAATVATRQEEGAWQLVDLEASGRIELGEHGSIALSDLYRATDLAQSESRSDG